jgi:hypothetical protein
MLCSGGALQRLWFGIVFFVSAVSIGAAQESSQDSTKNEIAGIFGHTFISDQSVPNSGLSNPIVGHGAGYTFEVNYARVLLGKDWADFAVEVPAIFNPNEKLHYATNQVPEKYSSIFLTPAARIRFFPDTAFSLWFSFGGGLGHFSSSSNLIFFGSNTGTRSVTRGVLQGGVGLDLPFPCGCLRHFKIRVEARDDWSGVPSLNVTTNNTRQHNYFVAGGLAYKF